MRADHGSTGYVAVGVGLIAFGMISLFSIGYPLMSIGVAHLALYRVRHRRSIRLPIMAGIVAFWLAFALVAPMTCSQTTGDTGTAGSCRSFTGIRYPVEDPSFVPGLIAGIAAAVMVAAVVRFRLRTRDAVE